MDEKPKENWGSGKPYEQYVGRWSRKIAKEFQGRLGVSAGQNWEGQRLRVWLLFKPETLNDTGLRMPVQNYFLDSLLLLYFLSQSLFNRVQRRRNCASY